MQRCDIFHNQRARASAIEREDQRIAKVIQLTAELQRGFNRHASAINGASAKGASNGAIGTDENRLRIKAERSQHGPRKTVSPAGGENNLNPAGDSFAQSRGGRLGQNSFTVEQRSVKIAGKDPRRTGLTRWHTPSLIGDNEISMYEGSGKMTQPDSHCPTCGAPMEKSSRARRNPLQQRRMKPVKSIIAAL